MKKRLAAMFCAALVAGAVAPVSATAADRAIVDPALASTGDVSVLMHVSDTSTLTDAARVAAQAGFAVGSRYESIDVFVAYGPAAALADLASEGSFEFFEANRVLSYSTDNSHKATRSKDLLDTGINGVKYNGTGVGVAIVDSGVDGTHPDLKDHMGGNVKILCSTPQFVATTLTPFRTCLGPKTAVAMTDTDTPSAGGHGTHVAGIAVGDGTQSGGQFHGAAPEATWFGVSVGTVITVENALDGLEWVLQNHNKVTPAIRVVNNSWGGSHTPYRTGPFHGAMWDLQEALVNAGVVVVFAAGNSGGNGNAATTSAECVNPTPGVICVANYDDQNTGSRNGTISSSSSRGAKSDPKTWPDLSAPGTAIRSTCRATLPVCQLGGIGNENYYRNMSGTSMAAPHVAGIVAQLLQAKPGLTPAQVEDILEDTAHKFSWGAAYTNNDPFNTDNSSSFEKGHGLVDAYAAVQRALSLP